jgi:hypothetical protein
MRPPSEYQIADNGTLFCPKCGRQRSADGTLIVPGNASCPYGHVLTLTPPPSEQAKQEAAALAPWLKPDLPWMKGDK